MYEIGAFAQMKIGDNPTNITANSILEFEAAAKGLVSPRVCRITGWHDPIKQLLSF